jgi:hypothetical protein
MNMSLYAVISTVKQNGAKMRRVYKEMIECTLFLSCLPHSESSFRALEYIHKQGYEVRMIALETLYKFWWKNFSNFNGVSVA